MLAKVSRQRTEKEALVGVNSPQLESLAATFKRPFTQEEKNKTEHIRGTWKFEVEFPLNHNLKHKDKILDEWESNSLVSITCQCTKIAGFHQSEIDQLYN